MKLQSIYGDYDENPVRISGKKSSFSFSQTALESSSSQMNKKFENQYEDDLTQDSNFLRGFNGFKRFQFNSLKADKSSWNSKEKSKFIYYKED